MRTLLPHYEVDLTFAGLAMNPARDCCARLVHWLLPIPGKGPSEWDYQWIPITAGYAGALAGAALIIAIDATGFSTPL